MFDLQFEFTRQSAKACLRCDMQPSSQQALSQVLTSQPSVPLLLQSASATVLHCITTQFDYITQK